MDNKMKLQVSELPKGWVDLGIGEPYLIIDALTKTLGKKTLNNLLDCRDIDNLQYLPPEGIPSLIKELEKRHDGQIIVGSGATQLLAASMYSLKKAGYKTICVPEPYWVMMPGFMDSVGMKWCTVSEAEEHGASAMLIPSPNNPDGKTLTTAEFAEIETLSQGQLPLIHDAAYCTPIFVDKENICKFGDVQIYSTSKMFGLSGIRLGYAVVHTPAMYDSMREYMEVNSMGTSRLSQHFLTKLLKLLNDKPELESEFIRLARKNLESNRKSFIDNIDPKVIDTSNTDTQRGMFLWCRPGPNYNATKTKCRIIDGESSGAPGYLRISLAITHKDMKQAIKNLNESLK